MEDEGIAHKMGGLNYINYSIGRFESFMSSLIDDRIFQGMRWDGYCPHTSPNKSPLFQLSKNISISRASVVLRSNDYNYEAVTRLTVKSEEVAVRIVAEQRTQTLKIYAMLLEEGRPKKVESRQRQILLAKELIKKQSLGPPECIYHLRCGCLTMAIKTYFLGISHVDRNLTKYYDVVLARNLTLFECLIANILRKGDSNPQQIAELSTLKRELTIARILSTTISNFNLSDDRSQFHFADQSISQQKREVKLIHERIDRSEEHDELERTIAAVLCVFPQEISAKNTMQSLLETSEQYLKKFKPLLVLIKINGDRKIEEYTYNMVKLEVKGIYDKSIGEGGSSFIYKAKTSLNFISSSDYSSYSKEPEKLERIIAIKRLKPQLEKRLTEKLEHQKQIVGKLKGGCTPFLPKYYGLEKGHEMSNNLLMEYIQGEQLETYIKRRYETISFWSKIYLLLNIIHGIRHLITFGIVHLDLKPMNVIVAKFLVTKIVDFGEAYHKDVCDKNYIPGLTFPYASPEVFSRFQEGRTEKVKIEYSQKQDVYAFGIIMSQVLFSSKIFHLSPNSYKEVYTNKQLQSRFLLAHERLAQYGQESMVGALVYMIARCLQPNPNDRPRFDWIGVTLKLILNSHINQ